MALPLPEILEGTRVRAGSVSLPLFFASERQLNAGLPLNLDPDAGPLSVVVFRGSVPSGQPAGSDPPSVVTGNVELTIGGQKAIVEFDGLTAGLVSLYQINAIVPEGLPAGDAEVILTVNGVSSPAGIRLSIE